MNVGRHSQDTHAARPFDPFHRDETYPRSVRVNFKQLETLHSSPSHHVQQLRTLLKYCDLHGINVRPDCTQPELAVAAARHFEAAPSVDEEGTIMTFLSSVVTNPDKKPFQLPGNLSSDSMLSGNLLATEADAASGGDDDADADADEDADSQHFDGGYDRGVNGGDSERARMRRAYYEEQADLMRRRSQAVMQEGRQYEHDVHPGRLAQQQGRHWERDMPGDTPPKMGGKRPFSSRSRYSRAAATTAAPCHGGGSAIVDRGIAGAELGEDVKSRKHPKVDRSMAGVPALSGGDGNGKSPPVKKRKGGGGWRAKNGEQVAVRDERQEQGGWILARVIKYTPESHQYELRDDDDKDLQGVLTADRHAVIRLDEGTKGVQKHDRVLAVFPDTTSFYLGAVHKVPKVPPGMERRIEVKFVDDADECSGRTPARPVLARYVVPVPEGFDEEDGKIDDGGVEGGLGDANDEGDDDEAAETGEGGEPRYVGMIRTALMNLPGHQGNLPMICAYIEEHFHDRLDWKSESSLRRTPAWKTSVRNTLAQHEDFCDAGVSERNVYTLADG